MDIRYKFFDEYIGNFFSVYEAAPKLYGFISDKGKNIMHLWVRGESIEIFMSGELCGLMPSFFGLEMEMEESAFLVKDWFVKKLGLKKVEDLLEFIPKE